MARTSFLTSYVRGEVLSGGWNLITKALAGANALIIISHLSVFKYGVYVLLLSYVALMIGLFVKPFADVVQNDVARFIGAGKEAEAKRLFFENVMIRSAIALLLFLTTFFCADIIAHFYGQDVAALVRVLSPIFLIDVLTTTLRTMFELRLRFGEPALRVAVYNGIKLLLITGALMFHRLDIFELFLIYLVASLLSLAVFIPRSRILYGTWAQIHVAPEVQILPIIRGHGKWRAMSQALSSASSNVRPWLIKFFINTEAVAIYSVAESMFGAIKTLLPSNTFVTLIPRKVAGDEKNASRILVRGAKYLVIVALCFAVGGLAFVPPLVGLIIPHYLPSLPYFALLLIILPLMGVSSIAGAFLFALQKQRFMFFVSIVRIPLSWALPVALLYFFGLWGMPFERILISLFVTVMYFGYLIRYHVPEGEFRHFFTFDATDRELFGRVLTQLKDGALSRFRRLMPR
ncbi:MAG TPA: oligosaccharide flippase family protein [Candidatus Paceibacterota bacterium]